MKKIKLKVNKDVVKKINKAVEAQTAQPAQPAQIAQTAQTAKAVEAQTAQTVANINENLKVSNNIDATMKTKMVVGKDTLMKKLDGI